MMRITGRWLGMGQGAEFSGMLGFGIPFLYLNAHKIALVD